jgi:thiol:disulfide interchange protein DsbD
LRFTARQSGRFVALFAMIITAHGLAFAAHSADNPIEWSARVKKNAAPLKPGSIFTLWVTATIDNGWHLYSMDQMEGGPAPTWLIVPDGQPFALNEEVKEPEPSVEFDPNFNLETRYFENRVTFVLSIRVAASASPGANTVRIDARYQACNDRTCLPPKVVHLSVLVQVARASAGSGNPAATSPVSRENPSVVPLSSGRENVTSQPRPSEDKRTTTQPATVPSSGSSTAGTQRSLRAFIWLAMGLGALSLLTPCVFPMIPITVSYFTNHLAHSRSQAIRNALAFGLGIVLTFTAFGLGLAFAFGAGGVNELAANPWINLLITAIFLGFALSLFGAFFIQIPPGLVTKLDGITRRGGTSELIGVLLMGLIFTLTSFTCTSPFVGTVLVMAAQGSWKWPLVGMIAFSTIFALPFFVLALMPQFAAQLPKSGAWMNSVKVVMGFLEIAAAMKFLSNADLIWHWGIFTRDSVLVIWIAIAILVAVYLVGKLRMWHEVSVQKITPIRIVLAACFLSIALWLGTGLPGRPLGEIESFLPPMSHGMSSKAYASSGSESSKLEWVSNDYQKALGQAKQEHRLVFINFTGYTCTNCRWMEANMFSRSEVRRKLAQFVLVELYTDGSGKLYEDQQNFQQQRFGTVALPYYAVVDSDGNVIATYAGLTRSSAEFISFLSYGFASSTARENSRELPQQMN